MDHTTKQAFLRNLSHDDRELLFKPRNRIAKSRRNRQDQLGFQLTGHTGRIDPNSYEGREIQQIIREPPTKNKIIIKLKQPKPKLIIKPQVLEEHKQVQMNDWNLFQHLHKGMSMKTMKSLYNKLKQQYGTFTKENRNVIFETKPCVNIWKNETIMDSNGSALPEGSKSIVIDGITYFYILEDIKRELKAIEVGHKVFSRTVLLQPLEADFRREFMRELFAFFEANKLNGWLVELLPQEITELNKGVHFFTNANFYTKGLYELGLEPHEVVEYGSTGDFVRYLNDEPYEFRISSPQSYIIPTENLLADEGEGAGKRQIVGGYFPYHHKLIGLDLSRFQIFEDTDDKEKLNCLLYALNLLLPKETIRLIEDKFFTHNVSRMIKTDTLVEISRTYKLSFKVVVLDKELKQQINYIANGKWVKSVDCPENAHNIACVADHWFINEKVKCSKFALNHYEEIKEERDWWNITKIRGKSYGRYENEGVSSFYLVNYLMEHKETLLKPVSLEEQYDNPQVYRQDRVISINDVVLPTEPTYMKRRKHPNIKTQRGYYDVETQTVGSNVHKLLTLSYKIGDERVYYDNLNGDATQFMNDLVEYVKNHDIQRLIMNAHCAKYDTSMIMKPFLLSYNCERLVVKGTVYQYVVKLEGNKTIVFRDTYKFLTMKLSDIAKSFGCNDEKAPYPYGLLNPWTLANGLTERQLRVYADAKRWTQDDVEIYLDNCKRHNLKSFAEYTRYYNELDVSILEECFEKFASIVDETFGLDINNYMTLSSMSQDYFINKDCFYGVSLNSGTLDSWFRRAIIGGRCMVAENKTCQTRKNLIDLDVNSLYPTAMMKQGFLQGLCKRIETFEDLGISKHRPRYKINGTMKVTSFFIEVLIKSVGKARKIPCIAVRNKEGIEWTNEPDQSQTYVIDKQTYEDWMEYQQVDIEVIGGVYYDMGRNNRVCDVIRDMYNNRLEAKKNKNSVLALAYKLIMNSTYGKMIEHQHESKLTLVRSEKLNNFLTKNRHFLVKYVDVCEGIHEVETYKTKNITVPRPTHLGLEILSMSKHIMNRVIYLGEDSGIETHYTDTDSIFIDADKMTKLDELFKAKYDEKLVDENQLGCVKNDKGGQVIDEAMICDKKFYFLTLSDGTESITSKGIKKTCWDVKTQRGIFERLMKGETEEFDLCNGGKTPCFKFDGLVISNNSLVRKVNFKTKLN